MSSDGSFQHTALYERLFGWRYLIVFAVLLLVCALAFVLIVGPENLAQLFNPLDGDPIRETDTPPTQAVPVTPTTPPEPTTTVELPTDTPRPTKAPTATPKPTSKPTSRPTRVSSPTPTPQIYVVKKGDTLWVIAQEVYGDGSRWEEIYKANKDLIKDPKRLSTGWKLRIP